MTVSQLSARSDSQRGLSLIGLLFWAIVVSCVALVGMKVLPTLNEFFTIQRAVNKIAAQNLSTVTEVRTAFDRQKDIEYSISSVSGKDLDVTKESSGRTVIRFAYDKEIALFEPVYLVIKYDGQSK